MAQIAFARSLRTFRSLHGAFGGTNFVVASVRSARSHPGEPITNRHSNASGERLRAISAAFIGENEGEPGKHNKHKQNATRLSSTRSCGVPVALALLPCACLLSGCAAVVVGALGGAGALGYHYASANNHPQATQSAATDPPADTATDPATDPPTRTAANLATNPWAPGRTDPPASMPSVPISVQVYHRSIGTAAEASERPGAGSQPNTAEGNLPSTIAANYPYNQTIDPPNPFAPSEIPRPIDLGPGGLNSLTTFTIQAQSANRSAPRIAQ